MVFDLSVSSLLDRFLRLSSVTGGERGLGFQYPRCWIVSSDFKADSTIGRKQRLSVSSLLDRFLRRVLRLRTPCCFRPFSILAVGSFPQTPSRCPPGRCRADLSVSSLLDRFLRRFLRSSIRAEQESFSILAVGSFPQTGPFATGGGIAYVLSVSSLLDRFLRQVK